METVPSVAQAANDRTRGRLSSRRLLHWALGLAAALLATFILSLLLLHRAAVGIETEAQETGAPPAGRLLDVMPLEPGFGRLFVQEWGPPDATPVLIVPGTGAWSGFWSETAQALASTGYRVIGVDLPPFGYSERDPKARYNRANQAARLIGALDALDACQGILIGHASGAGPVAEALLRYPHRLHGAVLVSAELGLPQDGTAMAQPSLLMDMILGSPRATRLLTTATLTNSWLTRQFLSSELANKDAATPAQADILRRPLRRTGTTEAYAAWLPFLFQPDTDAISGSAPGYGGLTRPVGLIWGAADPVTPLPEGQRLAQLIPGATLDIIPGAGHIPHIESPQETVRLLRGQLQRIDPRATRRNAPRLLDVDRCQLGGVGQGGLINPATNR